MSREQRRAQGQIAEIARTPDLKVKGLVTVDLLDERGRVKERQEASNYVRQDAIDRWARWAQLLPWTYGMVPGTITNTTDNGRDPRVGPSMFNDVVACWDDATAENPTENFCFGEVKAWAHRWGHAGVPALRQGLCVPSLCALAEDEVTWVWEWGTSNGNGTFQSVGWRRLQWGTPQTGDPQLLDLAKHGRRMLASPSATLPGMTSTQSMTLASSLVSVAAPYYDSGTGNLYILGNLSSQGRFVSVPVTLSPGGYTVGATVVESAHPIATHIGHGVAWTTYQTLGLCRLGPTGDWISVGTSGSTTARRCRIRRITPAGSLTYTNTSSPAIESGYTDVTYDGVNLYAVRVQAGLPSDIVVIDPATGNVSSTITISGLPSYTQDFANISRPITGIEWDAANGWYWLSTNDNRVFNIDASGVWQGVLMRTMSSSVYMSLLTLANPNAGDTSDYYAPIYRGPSDVDYQRVLLGSGALTTSPYNQAILNDDIPNAPGGPPIQGLGGNLITMDGDIWLHNGNGGSTIAFYGLVGITSSQNYLSRSLLGSPVTKTSSDSMRLSYAMQFT